MKKTTIILTSLHALALTVTAAFTDNTGINVVANDGSSGTAAATAYNTTAAGSAGYGFYAHHGGTIWGNNVTITTAGLGAAGVVSGSDGLVRFNGVTITTAQGNGVLADNGGVVELGAGARVTTGSYNGIGVLASGTGSVVRGTAMTIDADGFYMSGTVEVATQAVKARVGGLVDLGAGSTVITRGVGADGVGGVALLADTDSAIRGAAVTARSVGWVATVFGNASLILTDSQLTGAQGGISLNGMTGTSVVVLDGGSVTVTSGDILGASVNTLVAGGELVAGGITAVPIYATVTIRDAVLTGAGGKLLQNQSTGGEINIILDQVDSADAGGINIDDLNSGTTTVTVRGGSGINGDLINSGSGLLMVNLIDSGISGEIRGDNSAEMIVTATDSAISGDLIGSGAANLTVTVSGRDGSFLGDIAQHDEAAVTVIISDGATGSGGINGGSLITGGDSAWTFDKDSHGNYGENHGTWNIGDYDVTFDNLDHTGTITINVNSDTGAGGSITVTDTADGEGKIHITTTGDGQADPNKVLPGIVSGDGTEHWQWDPIDWGIDQLIKDGDHFVKNGTSPAGAVLNSSVAIQQAMWFAQQNSLLKRMGELRYGARASRPLADKDVRVPYHSLIENIWLRSYGQQLNVGSKVAGKAYEQLIYGVDLGTDHKFTLSADSDLYLGVYAGYGRSDLDYRTPGANGEINSYYGGLYATWLHSSGFYIDATFKAASVNNDLKAPYGNTQLTASYSDVNIGGSIEIGKKFTFADDWFIEPQFQVNYLHILAEDYSAAPLTISAQDLDALQLRIGSVFGRTIKLTNSGALQPYVKVSGVETISSGGTLRNGYQSTRANTDGARAEVGGGIIWQLDADNQLHLDYEASFGDKYDKPWGLSAGYRHQF